ncbi:2OG-Fe(II) oxygenase [Sneathiella sp. P13V-1]|uniref:HalD/BesD family halogenase n=1 Tax=Sneathiella sp. P13V-1 TaxID=2697366 RepID=UPI00187BA60C|nr:2OG-Fe(II) oxygenase [Sneathiella sp. P13V-1]MBE7636599.1 2OG-Fe(II) oxygenase [Sneathiella sp. P13V-1]
MGRNIGNWVDLEKYPLTSTTFKEECRKELEANGSLLLPGFLFPAALKQMIVEAEEQSNKVYYTADTHNVYLTATDPSLPNNHPFNRQLNSNKGCITTDQIPETSGLHAIYDDPSFKEFVAYVVEEEGIYPYADPLSGINVHFADEGRELNWHFDNSSFAITLLLQAPKGGGEFQYVRDLRDADAGEMNFEGVRAVLEGETEVDTLSAEPGTLALFRGRNSIHRVTPTEGDRTRLLVVLAYNNAPGVALSETGRMTFYGRLG